MKISLRKANAISNSIQELIKKTKINLTVELNEFQNIEETLAKANTELIASDTLRQRLTMALYNIRALVGSANAQSGISLKLATAAFIDKRIAQLEQLSDSQEITPLNVIKGKIEKIKSNNLKSDDYGYTNTVVTHVLSKEQITQVKAEILNLKKQKQKLNDEILELNIKTEVPLSDETVSLLQEEGLI